MDPGFLILILLCAPSNLERLVNLKVLSVCDNEILSIQVRMQAVGARIAVQCVGDVWVSSLRLRLPIQRIDRAYKSCAVAGACKHAV